MMDRRSFLLAFSTIVLSQWISGCSQSGEIVKILLLSGSIPSQLLKEFRKELDFSQNSPRPIWKTKSQLKDLFKLLQTWQDLNGNEKTEKSKFSISFKKQEEMADLITLGDYWLEEAIKEKLIQPLSLKGLSGWETLPSFMQKLVQVRGEDSVWGAPYRWGATAMAYRRDKLEELGIQPEDWQDLWRKELKGRISVLNQPPEVIGLTLKKLGHSYNTVDLAQVDGLKEELLALQQQVKFYESSNYLQPLILGDTWLAVGWSTDILPVAKRHPDIEVVVPRSGTSLWADLWVRPKQFIDNSEKDEKESIIEKWIDFCWQPDIANKISFYTEAASPILLTMEEDKILKDLRDNPLLLRNREILEESEFLSPLTKDVQAQYNDLWQAIGNSNAIQTGI